MLNQRTIFAYTHSFGRLARQAVACTAAVVVLTACGGGDGGGTGMVIIPDAPNTIPEASSPEVSATDVGGTVDETLIVGDVDVFRFEIDTSGTLEISVSGTAQVRFRAFSSDGSPLPVRNGMVEVEAGDRIFVEVSAAPGAGSVGTGSYWLETRLIPDTTASSTPPTI